MTLRDAVQFAGGAFLLLVCAYMLTRLVSAAWHRSRVECEQPKNNKEQS